MSRTLIRQLLYNKVTVEDVQDNILNQELWTLKVENSDKVNIYSRATEDTNDFLIFSLGSTFWQTFLKFSNKINGCETKN